MAKKTLAVQLEEARAEIEKARAEVTKLQESLERARLQSTQAVSNFAEAPEENDTIIALREEITELKEKVQSLTTPNGDTYKTAFDKLFGLCVAWWSVNRPYDWKESDHLEYPYKGISSEQGKDLIKFLVSVIKAKNELTKGR